MFPTTRLCVLDTSRLLPAGLIGISASAFLQRRRVRNCWTASSDIIMKEAPSSVEGKDLVYIRALGLYVIFDLTLFLSAHMNLGKPQQDSTHGLA